MSTMLYRNKQLAQAIAADIAALVKNQGDLSTLATTNKSTLVEAINELKTGLDVVSQYSEINDAATGLTTTWSSTKIADGLAGVEAAAVAAAQTALSNAVSTLQGVDGNFLTSIQNLQTALQNNSSLDAAVQAIAAGSVRFDVAQTLSAAEKAQARGNIGAIVLDDVVTAYGDPDFDTTAFYTSSKTAFLTNVQPPAL